MSRLDFIWDMNGDGLITIADVNLWVRWLVTLPGDVLRNGVLHYAPGWAQFWEMQPKDWMGWTGFFWSLPVWLGLWILVAWLRSDNPLDTPEPGK